jgi:hypothetical protein
MRTLVALALCYVMMVQGLAAHFIPVRAEPSALHTLCLSSSDTASESSTPADRLPDHAGHAPCCLIFGNGDLPRVAQLLTAYVFEFASAVYPLAEFSRSVDKRITTSPALPRAPPHMG